MEIVPYKDGRLVINPLLCYLDNKRKILDRDHLSRLIRDHFNDDEIYNALNLLHECGNLAFNDNDDCNALEKILQILDSEKFSTLKIWFAASDISHFPETNTELLLRILDQLSWIKASIEQYNPSTPPSEVSVSPPSIKNNNKRSLESAVAKLKEMKSAKDSTPIEEDYASMVIDCSTKSENCTPCVEATFQPLYADTNFVNSLLFNSSQASNIKVEDDDQNAESAFKPYVCQHRNCNKRFTNKFLLKKHEFIHTGLRPHQCNICFKKFNRKDNLLRHVKTHDKSDEGAILTTSTPPSSTKILAQHHIRPETGDKLCQLLKQKSNGGGSVDFYAAGLQSSC